MHYANEAAEFVQLMEPPEPELTVDPDPVEHFENQAANNFI